MYFEQYALAVTPVDDADVCYRRWRYTTGSGAVQFVEPGELYRTVRQRRPASNRMLLLSPAVVEQAARAMGAPGPPHCTAPVTWDPQLCAALLHFHASLGEPASLLQQHAQHGRYAERRVPAAGRRVHERAAVARAVEYLHAHSAENVSLDALARAAYLSKYQLVRVFCAEVGLPPHAYLLRVRTARAKALLAEGAGVSDAALRAGFAAQTHLHRHFLRTYGTTPGRYARAARGGAPA